MYRTEIAVIGAGAAGLMAAREAAAELKKQGKAGGVLILEGNQKIGKKLLATGNGRCNLTNRNINVENYHGDTKFLSDFLAHNTAKRVEDKFYEMGVLCRADSEGRVYPNNLQAAAVLKALKNSCEELGVSVKLEFNVFSVLKVKDGFVLKAESGEEIFARKCIIACGGKASPKHSCGINGYKIAKQFGHSVRDIIPSLVKVNCNNKILKPLKGMRVKAKVSLLGDNELIYSESGEVIFAVKGLSGICIFNLSSYISEYERFGKINGKAYKKLKISLDLLENYSLEEIIAILNGIQGAHPEMLCKDMLSGIVNIKLGEEIMKINAADIMAPIKKLGQGDINKIAAALKNLCFNVTGLGDWDNAQITSGGIPLEEIDMNNMESKKQRGLYFAGEILNVNGDCGGYNLHFAWTSGMLAGRSAAEKTIYV